ncbi:hypothetical protein GH741_20065 [Aquibacillus halophilus]|uniref:YitT family protein n=1 Tax=Aquibacillus halophilus TaxID=930132 RepID=A0A6A8DGZ3_9BACI|nr:hypothetical protein [Aquibacillus halophilus]MRH44943.1 hypothetical protein [Aquibacillus halophilus]
MIIKASFGTGFWSALAIAFQGNFGLTVGIWLGIIQTLVLILNFIISKKRPEYESIIAIFLESLAIDFWLEIVLVNVSFQQSPLLVKLLVLGLGIIIAALGIATYVQPNFPLSPVDRIIFVLSIKFNWSVRVSQTLVALSVTLLAYFLGGPVGVGTIIMTLGIGYCIQSWLRIMTPLYQRI